MQNQPSISAVKAPRFFARLGALMIAISITVMAQAPAPPLATGIEIGKKIPAFQLKDQNGKLQDFNSIRGPKGAALYFMRSADW